MLHTAGLFTLALASVAALGVWSNQRDIRRIHTPRRAVEWLRKEARGRDTDALVQHLLTQVMRLSEDDRFVMITRFGRMLKRVADPAGAEGFAVTLIFSVLCSTV